ncbi:sucrose-specific PTS transporter subunit IIBC [Faecalibaculum rodentium]|uniref:sucrose-specific PTS transporter subunit IIBC n=1 Tax=Faecalibaculum rodentium TaxID=1702221 RepID=UPI001C3D6CA7|nr:sucrose-specific PTS transporter subunit IIBC [Faecalibaculum rodentium]
MTDKQLAQAIIQEVGGKENIRSVAHCATRLRLIVNDKDLIQADNIENLDKVKGSFFNSGQYQIILGTGLVNRIYDEVASQAGVAGQAASGQNQDRKEYGNRFQRFIRMFADVFVPIIPVLVATGLFMGLRGLLTQEAVLGLFGMTPEHVPANLLLFTQILTDTAFAFLPALVCWSTFKNFGGSPVIGIVLGLMLVSPSLPSAYDVGSGVAAPLTFFGFLNVSGYQGSVLPAFVTGIAAAQFEKFLRRHVPDAIDLIVTPFLTLLFGVMLALFIVGPIMHGLENIVLVSVEWILSLPYGIGGLLYGSLGQLLGIFGVHHILNFLEISMLANTGWNFLNPIGSCGNMAQAGSVLAVGIKSKDNKIRQIAYPSALSAMLGITEPAVFGVNLRFVSPYVMALIGGGVGGFIASLTGLKATGMAVTGIPGMLLYLNGMLPMYILANVAAFATAFILTWLFALHGRNKGEEKKTVQEVESEAAVMENPELQNTGCMQPVKGGLIPLSSVKDPVFSSGSMGPGFGIEPSEGLLLAPCDCEVMMVFPTGHAIGLKTEEGQELLIHIGIDTVSLEGKGFEVLASQGQSVQKGQPLVRFDLSVIRSAGLDPTVVLVCTNSADATALPLHMSAL